LTGRPAPLTEAVHPLLALRSVWKMLGDVWVLRGATLTLYPGDAVLLYGPNGSGKTTLLRIAAGLMEPSRGEALVAGVKPARREAKRLIGYVAHHPLTYSYLTVEENLKLYAALHGVEDYDPRRDEAARILGLHRELGKPAGSLSYGWRRRLELARALLHNPPLLLVDEPFTGLDEEASTAVAELLEKHVQEGGALLAAAPTRAQAPPKAKPLHVNEIQEAVPGPSKPGDSSP